MSSLLRLLQLSSPTLPVGAYAYSQGIEAAVHSKLIVDMESAQRWLHDVLTQSISLNDLALLKHLYIAWSEGDLEKVSSLGEVSLAIRETHELRMEDQHLAKALIRLTKPLSVDFPEEMENKETYPLVFAKFAVSWKVSLQEVLEAFCWSWLENQIAAMVKLVPLGQTQGQMLMLKMDESIHQAIEQAKQSEEEDIGNSLPMLAILSAQHETQYTRLFRS
ncbi:urease accessory protein UreF [Hydrogenovibrio kuenenii]|uniref:urease accessory protein UreF n=1 Tax=Hydrogenovibrio kuenenii TaxID=63658 RepID=UPI000463F290|nr:urease accessory UreF family protein [Hydrogenovibrio kuenenii]